MEWTTIGTGIALLAVLAPLIIYTNSSLRNEVKAALAELRAELRAERVAMPLCEPRFRVAMPLCEPRFRVAMPLCGLIWQI